MRSTVKTKKAGWARGEQGCPIRRLRERHWVPPLERRGDLDVTEFLVGVPADRLRKINLQLRVQSLGQLYFIDFKTLCR